MLRVRFQSTGFPPSCPTLRASPSGLLASLVRSCSSLSLDCLSAMRPADPARLVGIVAREFLLAASACLRALHLFRGAREFIPADCPCLRPRTFFEGRVCGPRVRTFSILFRFAPFLDGLARFRASGARRAPRVDQGALPPFGIRRISTVLRLILVLTELLDRTVVCLDCLCWAIPSAFEQSQIRGHRNRIPPMIP